MSGVTVSKRGTIAVLYLVRGDLNQPRLWEEWAHECSNRVRFYLHPKFPDEVMSPWLKKAVISSRVATEYGTPSIIAAELALLKAALKLKTNSFFVLASESCVPIKPLRSLLQCLDEDGRSRLAMQTYDDLRLSIPHKATRFHHVPLLPRAKIRFHTQWWILNREAAEAVVEQPMLDLFAGVSAADESWPGTVLALRGYPWEERAVAADPTWTNWEATPQQPFPSSPKTYAEVSAATAEILRNSPCFFARKFSAESDIGRHGLHR